MWKIFYDDGTTRSSVDGPAAAAPAFGVLAIVADDQSHGRSVIAGNDFYIQRDGCWVGLDLVGVIDFFVAHGGKIGRMVPNAVFDRVLRAAVADPDFPEKTAWRKGERQPASVRANQPQPS